MRKVIQNALDLNFKLKALKRVKMRGDFVSDEASETCETQVDHGCCWNQEVVNMMWVLQKYGQQAKVWKKMRIKRVEGCRAEKGNERIAY